MVSFGTFSRRVGEFAIGAKSGQAAENERLRTERMQALSLALQSGAQGVDLSGQSDLFLSPNNTKGAELFRVGADAGLRQHQAALDQIEFTNQMATDELGLRREGVGLQRTQIENQNTQFGQTLELQKATQAEAARYHAASLGLAREANAADDAFRRDQLDSNNQNTRFGYAVDLAVASARNQSAQDLANLGYQQDAALNGTDMAVLQDKDRVNLASFVAGLADDPNNVINSDGNIDPDYIPAISQLQEVITSVFLRRGDNSAAGYATARASVMAGIESVDSGGVHFSDDYVAALHTFFTDPPAP